MNRYLFPLVLFLIALNYIGCKTWTMTNGNFKSARYGYSILTPKKWYERNSKKIYQISRDGCELDCITITTLNWNDSTGIYTRCFLSKNLLLHEIPKIFLADYVEFNLNILSEELIFLDNVGCAKTIFTFRGTGNVLKKATLICCPRESYLITLLYEGPERYYFEKHEETFEKMVQSIQFKVD